MRGRHTVVEGRQMLGVSNGLRRPGTDFVRESVDGLGGWSGDLVVIW